RFSLPASRPSTASPCSPAFPFMATSPTHLYTLSLHDALPISAGPEDRPDSHGRESQICGMTGGGPMALIITLLVLLLALALLSADRKSTRLNSSHVSISYAVFCLKKKNKQSIQNTVAGTSTLT